MTSRAKVMALGFFDGLHLGHAELIKKVLLRSKQLNADPSLLTFDIHPDGLVYGRNPELITDTEAKRSILEKEFGIKDLIILRFTDDLMKMDYEVFLDLLIAEFNVKGFVVGHDFTFGRNAEGNANKLAEYCLKKNITCDVIDPVYCDGYLVSSTVIRKLIKEGNISAANRLLGRNHFIQGPVVHGLHNGEKLGFPTVNIKMPEHAIVPKFGVYAALAYTDEGCFQAAADIGVKPTVCEDSEVLVESHLFDFDKVIYGTTVKIELCKYIREERRFNGLNELSEAINQDISEIKSFFNK